MIQKSLATADRGDRPITFVNFTAKAAMPARYALERADWAGAAVLALTPSQYPQADSLTRFARGLGMARSGNPAGAKDEIEAMKALRTVLEQSNQSYWADRTEEQMLAVSAWIALAEGDRDRARCGSCARPPIMKTAASSTWRWKIASTRCVSCSATCCWTWDNRLPR